MSESIKCPYCIDGSNMGDAECCGDPCTGGGYGPECCGEPIYNNIECDVCQGTDAITKQHFMELKLKGINPNPYCQYEEIDDIISAFTEDIQNEAGEFSRYGM